VVPDYAVEAEDYVVEVPVAVAACAAVPENVVVIACVAAVVVACVVVPVAAYAAVGTVGGVVVQVAAYAEIVEYYVVVDWNVEDCDSGG